jgi:hypothetical protein
MKFSKLALIGIVPIVALIFFACQKADLKTPTLTSNAGKPSGGGGVPAFTYAQPTSDNGCEGTTYCFDASVTKKNGDPVGGNNNTVTVSVFLLDGVTLASISSNPQVADGSSGHFCFDGLAQGQYIVKVAYHHANSDNAAVNVAFTFTLTIGASGSCSTENCQADGFSLTRSVSNVDADEKGNLVGVTTTYTVHNCSGGNPASLKLQGGLVNGASLIRATYSGDAGSGSMTQKGNGGNMILTSTFSLPEGGTQVFVVSYNLSKPNCNSYVTGPWSLKLNGITPVGVSPADESATQSGYMDRLMWNCN